MIIEYSFKNKKVCIIGTGKQARKKEAQFKKEQAIVYTVEQYTKEAIHQADFVYACTDNRALNYQIVEDANALGKESASVHYDESATIHLTLQREMDCLKYALFAPGTSIYQLRKFQKEIEIMYNETYKEEFEDIRYIRTRMIEENVEDRKEILNELSSFSNTSIRFVREAYEKGYTTLYCFHGNRRGEPLSYFDQFYAYEQENPYVPHISMLRRLFHTLNISCTYKLVTLQKGQAYQRIHELLEGEKVVDIVLDQMVSSLFDPKDNILCIVHTQNKKDYHFPDNWLTMDLKDDIPDLVQPCKVVPLFLIRAKHMEKDVFKKIYPLIQEKYPKTALETRCLLEYPEIREYIIKES